MVVVVRCCHGTVMVLLPCLFEIGRLEVDGLGERELPVMVQCDVTNMERKN